jgi:hypothetical protein
MARVGKRTVSKALGASVLASALIAMGCSSDHIHEYRANTDRVTSGSGNAMAANRAVHTIDPWPYQSQNTQIDIDGKRAQVAVRRYESSASSKSKGASSDSTPTNGTTNGDQKN